MKFSSSVIQVLGLLAVSLHGAGASCLHGKAVTKTIGDVKYSMCYFPPPLTYYQAQEKCKSEGMQLVDVRTAAKRIAVREMCKLAKPPIGYDCGWLQFECSGDDCQTSFANWKLPDGTSLASLPSGTNGMELRGTIVGGGTGETCSAFWGGMAEWGPEKCHNNYYGALCEKAPKPSVYGDPHFVTWSGAKYDFNGGCDLVFLQNNGFSNGLGMNIHIRTSIRAWWSYIESAILQIGDNTLQITGGKNGATYSINGAEESELVTGDAALGDYAIRFRRVNDHHTITRIDLGNAGDAIGMETFKDFVRVSPSNKKNKSFDGSMGLLGAYPSGAKIGRDGKTVFEDTNEFGQEWMVKPTDVILFPDVDAAAALPLKCQMPDEVSRKEGRSRRLGEGGITEEDARLACSRVSEHDFDGCVFDVLATQDKDIAGSY